MTPNQLRLARTRLGLGTRQLAEICNVSMNTIQAIENGEHDAKSVDAATIRRGLEAMGFRFSES